VREESEFYQSSKAMDDVSHLVDSFLSLFEAINHHIQYHIIGRTVDCPVNRTTGTDRQYVLTTVRCTTSSRIQKWHLQYHVYAILID
jgi:hypothetical protein